VLLEIAATMRKLFFIPPSSGQLLDSDKTKIIQDLRTKLEERYLKDADLSVPLYWLITQSTRHMLSRIWLVSHPIVAT
jgi:hypothetical protein